MLLFFAEKHLFVILRVCELLPICVDQGEYRLAAPSAA
jgi:hypothetical protein